MALAGIFKGAKVKFEFKSRFTGEVLFAKEAESLKIALEIAVGKRANLDGANLTRANLDGANLDGANLTRANLYGANLTRANLDGANLEKIKAEYLAVLAAAKEEVVGLYKAIIEGRVDGSVYSGDCACLKGTIANVRGVSHKELGIGLEPVANSAPERWFLAIRNGDTPAGNQASAITKLWTEEFMAANGIAIPVMTVSWSDSK